MRTLLIASALLVMAGCNGNWSNDDLEYAGALPSRETLRSELPTDAAQSMQGLRRDPLLGDPSEAYAGTKSASDQFNGLVDFVTMVLDAVVKYPPTVRATDSRTWGPWEDTNNPGRQFKVTITRGQDAMGGDQYAWSIDTGDRGLTLTPVATGHYLPTDTVARGIGDFRVDTKKIREETPNSMEPNPVDAINVEYDTRLRETPKQVQMTFEFTPGGEGNLSTGGYRYRQELDGSGLMRFDTKGGTAEISALSVSSRWVKTGAGRTLQRVEAGTYMGAEATECWDDDFKVVFQRQNWPGGVTLGAETACAVGPE